MTRARLQDPVVIPQISKRALERSEQWRMEYMTRIGTKYDADQLVFVDESSFDRRTSYRGYAWALKGRRAIRKCFYVRGKRYVLMAVIDYDTVWTTRTTYVGTLYYRL